MLQVKHVYATKTTCEAPEASFKACFGSTIEVPDTDLCIWECIRGTFEVYLKQGGFPEACASFVAEQAQKQ